ncbi:GNAT family N-acetyltransferase [Haladaptatus salinisoli]|uniref:GNAT family N-acetyltransferase n=1 Tax=Haladaptatus salinisoli TaxID=2884876 RepID=UPI001D0B14D1|nr:GNAT family N-acetyltransferase [Haladaptatus salinisoli]
MLGPVFPEGDRVELRVTEREDLDLLQRVRTDPELRIPMTFTEPQTREQVEEFYENTVSADSGDSNFVVCVDGEPVGEANLFRVEADRGEIAYWLDRDERGEGYATEAVSLLLDYAFDTRGLHRVVARVVNFDEASHALLKRLRIRRGGATPGTRLPARRVPRRVALRSSARGTRRATGERNRNRPTRRRALA